MESYPELFENQLRAAISYYRAYPEEIEERLALEGYWTTERVAEDLPFAQRVGS